MYESRIHIQRKLFDVELIYASSAELVRERYAVQAIPTVETNGLQNVSNNNIWVTRAGKHTIWNWIGITLKLMICTVGQIKKLALSAGM